MCSWEAAGGILPDTLKADGVIVVFTLLLRYSPTLAYAGPSWPKLALFDFVSIKIAI